MSGCLARLVHLRNPLSAVGILTLALLAAGCGEGNKTYSFHPVKGRVLLGDNPMQGGTIRFTMADDPNFVASSPIAADGSFTLQTSTTNPARITAGAPEGKYEVIVAVPPVPPSKTFPSITAPECYTVVPGENDFTIQLQ